MELYFIDCIWILLTIAGVAITSPKIITNNSLFQQLTTFGKTRVKSRARVKSRVDNDRFCGKARIHSEKKLRGAHECRQQKLLGVSGGGSVDQLAHRIRGEVGVPKIRGQ